MSRSGTDEQENEFTKKLIKLDDEDGLRNLRKTLLHLYTIRERLRLGHAIDQISRTMICRDASIISSCRVREFHFFQNTPDSAMLEFLRPIRVIAASTRIATRPDYKILYTCFMAVTGPRKCVTM
jgi:hypothetical protein